MVAGCCGWLFMGDSLLGTANRRRPSRLWRRISGSAMVGGGHWLEYRLEGMFHKANRDWRRETNWLTKSMAGE